MLQQSWRLMMRAGMRGLTMWIENKSHRFSAGRIRVTACAKQQQQFPSLWRHAVFQTCIETTWSDVEWGSTCMLLAVFLSSGLLQIHSQFLITDPTSQAYSDPLPTSLKMRRGGVSQNTAWSGIAVPAKRSRERPATGRSCSHTRF